MFYELIKGRATNMTSEYMSNFNTSQIDSGTLGYPRPQFASCSTNKESNSINYYDSKKSASNFKNTSRQNNNISAQKKKTNNKEEVSTTKYRIAEAAPAAATSESHLKKKAAGATVDATHALGNSSNKQIMDQSTTAQHSSQPTGRQARLPTPPLKTPPPRKPSLMKTPGTKPPSRPPQRQATSYITGNAPEAHKAKNISRNKNKTTQHTTIILQRTYKKGKGMQWHKKTPPQVTKNKNRSNPKRKNLKDMMMNAHTKITPYVNHYSETENFAPLFLASQVVKTPGRYGYVYFACKACKKEMVKRENFISHHQTLGHLQNMKKWIKKIIHNNYKDQIQHKTKKVSIELIREAQEAIAEHLQKRNQLRTKIQIKNNQQPKGTYPSQEKEITEVIQDVHQNCTRIPKTPKQTYDADFATYSKARQAIIQECPTKLTAFKSKILKLLSNMYADRQKNNLRLQFSIMFYGARKPHKHWIIEIFETIKRRPNAWKFVKDNVNQNNPSFAWKNEAQKQELKRISGMARTLFHILLDCHFIPTSYLILLAIFMSTEDNTKYEGTSVCLNNGMMIDLTLQDGAIIFQKLKQKTGVIRLEEETLKYKNDVIQYWRDNNPIFTSELAPTILLSRVDEDSESEIYQTSGDSYPFNPIRQNMTTKQVNEFYNTNDIKFEIYTHLDDNAIVKNQEYEKQETETDQHPGMNQNLLLKQFESMKQNTTEEIATQKVIFNPETEQPSKDSGQSWHETEILSEFDIQCNRLLPITPQTIAKKLFQHWGEELNFNGDVHKANNGTFIIETVDELTNLARRATPYHTNHEQMEVGKTSNGASKKNIQ